MNARDRSSPERSHSPSGAAGPGSDNLKAPQDWARSPGDGQNGSKGNADGRRTSYFGEEEEEGMIRVDDEQAASSVARQSSP